MIVYIFDVYIVISHLLFMVNILYINCVNWVNWITCSAKSSTECFENEVRLCFHILYYDPISHILYLILSYDHNNFLKNLLSDILATLFFIWKSNKWF